jgi:hypothetical protein
MKREANRVRIDIGNGKVLGTKRVSPNGQVSGFTEYAGREVLVVLPGEDVDVRLSPGDLIKEVQAASTEHMKVAFHKYKDLKRRFDSPENATRAFLAKYAPETFQGLYDKVETWAKDQLDRVEGKVETRLDPSSSSKSTE